MEGEWEGSIPLTAVKSVQLLLSDAGRRQQLTVVHQQGETDQPQSMLLLTREQDLDGDDDNLDGAMQVIVEADWLVKCAAHLVLATRRGGGRAQLQLPPE